MIITCSKCAKTATAPMRRDDGAANVGALAIFAMGHAGMEHVAEIATLRCACGAEPKTGPETEGSPEFQFHRDKDWMLKHFQHEGN